MERTTRGSVVRAVGVGTIAMALAGATACRGDDPTTEPAASAVVDGTIAPVASTPGSTTPAVAPSTASPRAPDHDLVDIAVVADRDGVRPGDTVNVTVSCGPGEPGLEAGLVVDHAELGFPPLVTTGSPEIGDFTTSFTVPYWLTPGDLTLTATCPRPAGACDDTSDCEASDTVPAHDLIVPVVAGDGEIWDAWRPLGQVAVATDASIGQVLPGGMTVTEAGDVDAATRVVSLDASPGDRVEVTAACPPGVDTSGARFVVVPDETWGGGESWRDGPQDWTIEADPDAVESGRFVITSEDLFTAVESLGDSLPWFLEVPASSTNTIGRSGDEGIDISAVVDITPDLTASTDGDLVLSVTALCADVGMPWDPRSVADGTDPAGVTISVRR